MSGDFTYDSSLIVENETLKKEVDELSCALGKAYGGEARLPKCLGSQRFFLNKEGLGYVPKKGKISYASHKTQFVRSNGKYCYKYKHVGHIEKECNNKNNNISSIHFDFCYILSNGVNGVHAKFVCTPIVGANKNVICVPKSLVTNLGGPNKKWVPKKN